MNIIQLIKIGLFCIAVTSNFAFAGGAIIVNSGNSDNLSDSDIKNIYLAKTKSFPSGEAVQPVNLTEGSSVRENFSKKICGKNDSQMKSYWAKLVFTGKAVPLKQLDSDQAVIDFVSQNKNAIGYVSTSDVPQSVKVVGDF